jgi:hypothetical protein
LVNDTNCPPSNNLAKDGVKHLSAKQEWRYFVTSLSTADLSFARLLLLVRLHWAIENRHHWTQDMVLEEDDRQPCLRSRCALEVTAWLRVLAYKSLLIIYWAMRGARSPGKSASEREKWTGNF